LDLKTKPPSGGFGASQSSHRLAKLLLHRWDYPNDRRNETMDYQATSLLGDKEIGIAFTDKPRTPWGGLSLFVGLARQVGLEKALRDALPFELTSPNATDPVEIVLAFMAGVLAGSRRLAHVERLRWDESVRQMLGVKRFVSDTTLARFFRRFSAGSVATVFEQLLVWQAGGSLLGLQPQEAPQTQPPSASCHAGQPSVDRSCLAAIGKHVERARR